MFDFYMKFKFLVVVHFHAIFLISPYYFKFFHFVSLVGFNHRKTLTCYAELTKYVLNY